MEKQVAAEAEDIVADPHLIHSGQDFMALAAGGEMSAALLSEFLFSFLFFVILFLR